MSPAPQLRSALKEKPIAVFGYGTSGRGVKALAERMGYEVTFFDEKEIEGTRQSFIQADAHHHSAVVLSPGFPDDHSWIIAAAQAGLPILSELDFGALFMTKGVYAVTGSNGKTTTVEFLTNTLNVSGMPAVSVGNNGRSLCAWLAENLEAEPQTRLVVEISSFQAIKLNLLNIDGLIWTNFSENHLDYHTSLENYFAAKWSLVTRLSQELFVMGSTVFEYANQNDVEIPDFAIVVPNVPQSPDDILPADSVFGAPPFDEDFRLCVAFGERIGIPRIVWHQTANSFALPKHRLTKVTEIKGVTFYNDAKSTTFASTLAALKRFEKPVLWIGGGKSKGGSLAAFAQALAPKIKAAYLIGETAEMMTSLLRREGVTATVSGTLDHAIKTAFAEAGRKDVILFSPAFSSLDQFENFAQRGNFFEKHVLELLERKQEHTKDTTKV